MDNKVFNHISYGLYVLFTSDGTKPNACIVNTLMQQTSSPLKVSVTVNKGNYTCDLILKTGRFNICMLDITAGFDIFRQFGFRSGRSEDKVSGFSGIKTGPNNIPYLIEHVNAYLSCNVISSQDMGSHVQFLAEAGSAVELSDRESMTYAYYHKHVKPKPETNSAKGWRCSICNFVFEGDELPSDYVCPLCKHGASDFVRID